ncbi:glyoxalase I [Suhomyces tanzawaensis NRRL Y-17324]|uniref:Lactoylglutathione lyase n=1 Tax=Suhomyces tanzawaensis NRRL Y-17324 TaxID=984487 RepID=A0A1E4SLK1_9ASCO|nr:glyoxalase I [Suhomyces tanzawaensis NRRL Y-17324]ODV80403.1 glyoxalase I [Suhomyces tanzawaensis NRRL Y-17324]
MLQGPVLNHTCLRVKDPKVSIPFYEKHFGFVKQKVINGDSFSLYILGIPNSIEPGANWGAQSGLLELKHDFGSENDPNFSVNNGNDAPHRGFGHICVSVDNIVESEKKLLADGVQFKKKLSDGRQKNIAFVLDPDGYWIELIENGINKQEGKTDLATYKLNHTMVRVTDPKKSLDFYRNVLGFKLLTTLNFEEAKFSLYFLAFDDSESFVENVSTDNSQRTGILELTHNWGTESDPEFKGYHNGNTTEDGAKRGYGHICVSVKDPLEIVSKIDSFGSEWIQKYGEAGELGFFRDPDGYEIEIFHHGILPGTEVASL